MRYEPSSVEKKWQERWERDALYRTAEDPQKKKAYVLDMFPYPSGEGLHVGHPKGYIATDIYSRKKRMQGYAVLHPMGWDAFGLPAENFALTHKTHPRIAVEDNIARFKAQLAHIGFDYDWSREINTTDPTYYSWTQWIFLKLFEHGLAYQSDEPINWCPSCMTGLANEDLDGNVCERCDTIVEKRRLPQWVLKITDYADRMLAYLDALAWPEHIKEAQRNWIGRSEGAEIRFDLSQGSQGRTLEPITVFTTRPDTLFGATYLVLAPEHPLLSNDGLTMSIMNASEVRAYVETTAKKTERERSENKEKTGVRLEGVAAVNPATKEEIPVFVADYVLASYGTGAIMAVPAHDERDGSFAQRMGLPVRVVIEHSGEQVPYTGAGTLINSGDFTGRASGEAMGDIVRAVGGEKVTRYKLRDWVFSRQRYWGEPIPIIHCERDGAVAVPYEDLPVRLPDVTHYEPTGTGESPLAAITDWVNVACPKCGGPGKRETNTMPQWAGSSWYYLRFMDPSDDSQPVSAKREKYWAPVDVYVGGDHAVRHLIYARFWHKFLYDIAVVSTPEPFARLEFLGFILAEDGRKMSKRLGNVINPDDVVAQYGADAFRAYEMFMGPFENTTAWSTASIAGTARFLERLWNARGLVRADAVSALESLLQQTVKKIGDNIEAFKFNTAVSQAMIFLNALEREGKIGRAQWSSYLRLLAPFTPHITEELWEELGETSSIHVAPWPAYDDSVLVARETEVVAQVNGKRRGSISLAASAGETDAVHAARALPAVVAALGGKEPKRVVYVPGKIVNLVV
ncbi:leucine--tRNA ligase [Candidatus Kaiserbacteria bacterium]|nr:leucine--tRNA ligase [Candidatus Kaiserbacteria bacterium]